MALLITILSHLLNAENDNHEKNRHKISKIQNNFFVYHEIQGSQ